ncbi:hypothetical protein RND81_14G070100 [Saponaria officinalis]|uniref:Bromodomain associated domain-containing protein n=1 Tax=Saponaria officinalis TaxID=3572 RepID=A0AAW1GV38_SAPOF
MSNPKTPTTPSQFTHSLSKTSVALILHSTGFKSATSAALETLTRVATLFLRHLASSPSSSSNPTLNDVVSAIDDLNFPLDFSLPQLARFLATSDHLPFPRRVPRPEGSLLTPPAVVSDGGCRGAEVPLWLPAFPKVSDDNSCVRSCDVNSSNDGHDDEEEKLNVKEVYWEERCGLPTPVVVKEMSKEKVIRKTKRGRERMMVCGRRERVKFRLGIRKKVNDLELKNGVCRGGKRISFVNRVGRNSFFEDDEGE